MLDLLILDAYLATPLGSAPRVGDDLGRISLMPSVNIGIKDGKVAFVGDDVPDAAHTLDAAGCLVTPGLVDCHTHLVFGGSRQNELSLKLGGADYLEILSAGGGILSTVKATRASDFDLLFLRASGFLDAMLRHGTTTVEAKSGYGLDVPAEILQLEVAAKLNREHRVDVVSTFMGAHAVPSEYKGNADGYVDLVVNEMIPMVSAEGLAEFCDVFCETGVFDVEQSRRVLMAAQNAGLGVKIHTDEINNLGGSLLAAQLGAISAEHLITTNQADLEALSAAGTIAVLLPTTGFYLGKEFARAREMVDMNIPIAVASDFNPGSSPNFSLQLAMTIACLKYRLLPSEVLTAVTLNAACAIGRGQDKGSIEVGKDADLVIWDSPDLDYLLYRFGNNQVLNVVVGGEPVE